MDEERREEIALFWYKLLVPLLDESLSASERAAKLRELTAGSYRIPNSRNTTVSPQTLRRKLRLYREHGFAALKPAPRADQGRPRSLPEAVLQKAIQLRQEVPSRSTRTLARLLEADSSLPCGRVPISTLARLLRQRECTRRDLRNAPPRSFRKWQREHVNEVWQSDLMQGLYLPHPREPRRKRVTHLLAFLDDCSRLITHAEFYWDEKLPRLEDCLKKALLRRGVPQRLYVDNGQVFRARQLQLICAEMGIRISHSEPYQPEGRGKVERFFAFVQTDFLPEAKAQGIETLTELNEYLWSWVEMAYHRKVHSEMGMTPLDRWLQEQERLRFLSPLRIAEIFLWRENRVVDKYGTLMLQNNRYRVDTALVGKTVQVRYDPFDLSQVYLYQPDGDTGLLLMKVPADSLQRPHHRQVPPPKQPADESTHLSVRYLDLLRQQHQQHQRESLGAVSFAALQKQAQSDDPQALSFPQLKAWAEHALGHPLEGLHQEALRALHDQFGPFRKEHLPQGSDLAPRGGSATERLFSLLEQIKRFKLGGV